MSAGALDLQQILQRLRASEWVDLTHSFAPGVPHYHQFPDEQREQLFDYPDGFLVHEYRHVGQWGTHVDPPSHFIEGGRTLDQLPVTDMVLDLVVLDARSRVEANPDYAADASLVAAHEAEHGPVPEGAFVALRTGWSARWPDPEAFDNGGRRPGWDVSALEVLVDRRGIAAIGHETTDTDPAAVLAAGSTAAETFILDRDRWQIEGMASLEALPARGALIVAAWPKPAGGSGFPGALFRHPALMSDLPDSARCVVIGGGVGGTSIAYHLGLAGWDDVVLLEQHELGDGTTWHSAGFVGQLRATITQTRMIMYSTELYARLGDQTGRDPGWRPVGGLRVATTPERQAELERAAGSATTYGLSLDLLSPAQTKERLGLLNVDDLTGSAWMPGDGYVDPELLALALADGARRQGVAVHTGVAVTGIDVDDGRATGVQTSQGSIDAEVVVIAAGAATGVVGALAGAVIPITPMRHQYVVTEPLAEGVEGVTTVRDPDHIMYFRPHDSGGLLVGGYSREPVTWDTDAPLAEARTTFEPDMERFAESWEGARNRVPALRSLEPAKVVNAPEAFTPDGDFILGETEVDGLWTAAGFCVHGLAGAGGVGKVMAEWITNGRPEFDMASMDIRRFGAHYGSKSFSRTRALSAYSRYYDIVYPHQEFDAGRPLRLSPAYPRLAALDASFGEKAGWERVNWFGSNAGAGDESLRPRGWAGEFWSPAIGAECVAARDAAALFDQSSFAKIDVRGPGAAAVLSRLCANDVAGEVGRAVYTQLLNDGGGIEADLTVTRVGEESFRVVTGTAFGRHDLAWIRRHLPRDGSVTAEDVTGSRCCYCLWGPAAREILSSLTDDDLSFKFLRARELSVGPVPVFAQRITFVGELGWELYASAEFGLTLWDLLWEAGREHGLVGGGYRAIDSMRLEKGYRVWGLDITPETTPDEAGLSFAVAMDKEGGFIGHDALAASRAGDGPAQKLRCLVLDDPRSVCLGSEPVRVDGSPVGRVTSGGYGHRVSRSIAFAYLPAAVEEGTRVDVAVFGEWIGAEVVAEPLYDPKFERVRG